MLYMMQFSDDVSISSSLKATSKAVAGDEEAIMLP